MILRFWKNLLTGSCLRLYVGGGGDGGAADMRRQEEERQGKVQAAVDAINAKFGIGPAAQAKPQPAREQFMVAGRPAGWTTFDQGDGTATVYDPGSPATFDEAGYNKAVADWQANTQGAAQGVQDAKTAREAMYSDISNAVRDTALRDLDRQYTKASRANTFGLARAGLLGGSADAEAGGQLQELYGEGKLKAEQAGLGAASDLRATDEKTRQNLISLAQSGIDTGTASSLAAGQMSAAAGLAKSNAAGATVGNLFDNLGQAYLTNQYLKARYPNGLAPQPSGYGTNVFQPSRYTGSIQQGG